MYDLILLSTILFIVSISFKKQANAVIMNVNVDVNVDVNVKKWMCHTNVLIKSFMYGVF